VKSDVSRKPITDIVKKCSYSYRSTKCRHISGDSLVVTGPDITLLVVAVTSMSQDVVQENTSGTLGKTLETSQRLPFGLLTMTGSKAGEVYN